MHLPFDRPAIECVSAAAYAVRRREEDRYTVSHALPDPLLISFYGLDAIVFQGHDGKPVILVSRKGYPVIMYLDHGYGLYHDKGRLAATWVSVEIEQHLPVCRIRPVLLSYYKLKLISALPYLFHCGNDLIAGEMRQG